MSGIKDVYQSGDWKAEKHVPVIEAPNSMVKGEVVTITVGIGKEIAHPNTTEHHISAVDVYFHPAGEKFAIELGKFSFSSHGASAQGANTSTVYTVPEVIIKFKTDKPGTLLASSYCNIHGLWENAKEVTVS